MSENYDLIMLQRKLDSHLEEYERRCKEEDKRWQHLIEITESNAQAQRDTAEAVRSLSEATRSLLEVWNAANGAVKVGRALGQFVKWLSGFAVIGGVIAWLVQSFGHPPVG